LSPEAREMIHVRLMDALNHPPMPVPRPRYFHPVVVIAAVLIVGGLIASGVLFVLSRQNQVVPIPTSTLESTATPTNTVEPTMTAIPTTVAPAVGSSPVLLPTTTLTPTLPPTATQIVSSTLLPTAITAVMVIQGPVEKIGGNIVTIYGIQVQIAPNNPILITVKVGDILRVEGNQTGTAPIIIVATTVTVVNVNGNGNGGSSGNGNVNPSSSGSSQAEVWADDGSCAHPPPDWAPANGWRRRCQGQESNNNNGNENGGKPHKNKP